MRKTINTILAAAMIAAFATATMTAHASDESVSGTVVNINTATEAELCFLPGVGPSKAKAIVTYRSNRPFKKAEQIMRVKGIGRKSFNKMRDHLAIDGTTTAKKKIKPTK